MEGNHYKKGLWTVEEDKILIDYVSVNGKGRWSRIAKKTGLKRNGKSCRLRWMNYLCPSIKRESFSEEEEDLIIRLHSLLGNRWSLIASRIPGRTDNQVKNHWNTHLRKKLEIVEAKTNSSVGDSSAKLTQQGEGGENQAINCPLQAINTGESDTQMQLMSPEYHLSPWFSNDDLFSIAPTLMEPMNGDGHITDVIWHHF